jgi:diguanylate cyclase (GGDEF)-like protein/PAS domain S-box-containing protein
MLPFSLAVLLVVVAAQQLWIYFTYRRAKKRDELFRIITENAADMIALVDTKGRRLYNSPAYKRILGYSAAELAETPVFEQIHPDDRFKVLEAAREARATGVGRALQYRLRHKNGSWRILESTASTIKNSNGEVEKLVIVNRDVTPRVEAEEKLAHNALHDALTGLPNRRLFLDRLERCHTQAQRDSAFRYALLLADIDGFKNLNHRLGSAAGDQALIEISRRLEACLRKTDVLSRPGETPSGDLILSRVGGDEFAVLLEACSDPSDMLRVAERIQSAASAPLVLRQGQASCSFSIGIALSTSGQARADDLLRDVETALRRAQAMGRGRAELFDPAMHNRAVGRLKLESDLRTALNHGQLRVRFQPVFQINPRQIVGFEALIRWQHPEQGLISPGAFLYAAEDSGLMALIDQWVIRQACLQLPLWRTLSPTLHVAVNLSARHFASPQLLDGLKSCLRDAAIPPNLLQLAITQATAMADPDRAVSVFAQLRRLEISTALDNFGTSPVSLAALRRLSPDVLKIDRALVAKMQSDRATNDVVDLTLTLATKLTRNVVAQGVESTAQLDRLHALGCRLAQGYFFSPPLDSQSAQQFLATHSRLARL